MAWERWAWLGFVVALMLAHDTAPPHHLGVDPPPPPPAIPGTHPVPPGWLAITFVFADSEEDACAYDVRECPPEGAESAPEQSVCRGRGCYTHLDTDVALIDASPMVRCIVYWESRHDPNAIGPGREQGIAQLHPRGLLPLVLSMGVDPWNPFEVASWLSWAIDHGLGPHWSTFARCARAP